MLWTGLGYRREEEVWVGGESVSVFVFSMEGGFFLGRWTDGFVGM